MRKIILIGGAMAAGKSTFSRFLQGRFNLSLLNKDRLKEILGDLITAKNREENKYLSVIAFQMIKYFLETSKGDLIIESNFKQYEIDEIKGYLKNCDCLSIVLTGDVKELHERFLRRLSDNRHPVHHNTEFYDLAGFSDNYQVLTTVKMPGEVIHFDVSNENYPNNDLKLLERISNFLNQ